ncbi:MAG: hypothetical protein CBB68_12440 [Rhodospirillaceae bacterium TMED8]|nr:ammonia monooxygenase [Magnetovibrio sp.]OUT48919.1 MAG: hypothetical protein CBB68_12440 [Rhodospirillaceae bacterium TMED8]
MRRANTDQSNLASSEEPGNNLGRTLMFQRRMSLTRWFMLIGMSLTIGTLGGLVFHWLTMPLAWMIGAMVFTTVAALMGAPVRGSRRLRSFMVPVLGIMLGSAFTPETLGQVDLWVPSILVMLIFVAVVIGCVGAFLYKIMDFGPVSAYFSATPGGLATMAIIGTDWGGDERRIGLVHSVRILLTVLIIPLYFRIFEGYIPGGLESLGSLTNLQIRDGLILIACALGFPLFKFLNFPSAQILGPMVLSAIVHLMGITEAKPPVELVNLAQLVIGTGIGARFAGVSIFRLFKVMMAAAASTIFMVALAAACASGLSHLTGLPFHAIWLAFAPGGVAEMTLISLSMGIDVAFVSTHHVIRVTFMVIAAPYVFLILQKYWSISEDQTKHGL